MIRLIPVQVECYAGYKDDETPRGFTWNDRRYDIQEIVDRWYQASQDPMIAASDYYKVRTVEGTLFIIRRDRETLVWQLVGGI
jgi:hypothetical protein